MNLPEKLNIQIRENDESSSTNRNFRGVSLSVNELIDYCEHLEKRVSELERLAGYPGVNFSVHKADTIEEPSKSYTIPELWENYDEMMRINKKPVRDNLDINFFLDYLKM